ncbi:MAG: prephenate dehydrogenase [Planctomycetota bacterium]
MKDLRQVSVIGLGLLGGSVSLAVLRSFSGVKTVGYSHRGVTRRKARELGVCSEVFDDIQAAVCTADIVVLATPIFTFEEIFDVISGALPAGCIVTDVGSTKVLPHRWAAKSLAKGVWYVGSHPIAGSEQRGIEFARDDLFEGAMCILTATKKSSRRAVGVLKGFWSELGCGVKLMSPAEHDRILGKVSHLPHVTAVALMNASDSKELKFAGKGFMDTSRIASGPANIWTDAVMANAGNVAGDIDKIVGELLKLKKAVKDGDGGRIEELLERARRKRATLIRQKIKSKEIVP